MGKTASLIRALRAEDLPALAVLEQECFSDAWNEAMLQSETGNKFAYYVVLETENGVVGYAGLWLVADDAEIHRVAVTKSCRALGYGKELTLALVNFCQEQKAAGISLEVRDDNVVAQKTYAGVGFKEVGRRKNYYGNGIDAIIMSFTCLPLEGLNCVRRTQEVTK